MNTIGDYVKLQTDTSVGDTAEKILRLRARAIKHQQESERLLRRGDPRQAAMHASIARTHAQSALLLEVSETMH